MGLLSFLTRKRLGDKTRAKTQAADVPTRTAVPEQAPAPRIDHDPEETRGRLEASKIVTASSPDLSPDYAAPAPAIPLVREDSVDRPSTAPIGKAPSTSWASPAALLRKNQLRAAAPPISFRAPRPNTANPLSASNSSAGSIRTLTGHSRTNSLLSEAGSRSKDLLDAQSEIRPADFKSRVKASGARDYGEDVADRNIGENGIELQSPAVQAFYAQAEVAPLVNGGRFSHHKSSSSLSSSYGFRNKMRRNTLTTQGGPMDSVSLSDSNSQLLRRRQSVNTYLPPSSVGNESDPTSRRRSGLRVVTNSIMAPKAEKPTWDLSAFPSLGLKSPSIFGPPKTPRLAPTARPSTARPSTDNSPRIPRESLVSARQNLVDDGISFSPPPRSPPRSRRGSVQSTTGTYPRKCHSLQTLQYAYTSHSATREPLSDVTPLSYPRHKQPRTVKPPVSGYTTPDPDSVVIDFDIAASPTRSLGPSRSQYLKTPFTIHESQEETPSPSPDILHPTHPSDSPPRARSTRGWSVSSATPTASDTSSNPFPRSGSAHTANTSIDLSSLKQVPSTGAHAHDHPAATAASDFNIDDYLSSDSDSFTAAAPRRPRAEGEEDLLFADTGYGGVAEGGRGFQLPGLCDAFPTSPNSVAAAAPVIPDYPLGSTNASRRFILTTAADSEVSSDDDHSDEEEAFVPRPVARGGTKRLSALCSSSGRRRMSFAPIVEEERGRVDVAAAVRLRKETKARRRASGMPGGRPGRVRAAGPVVVIRVEHAAGEDEGNYGDVEE